MRVPGLPYDPTAAPAGERLVRQTILRVVRDHCRDDAVTSWSGCDLDLRGAVFDGADLDRAHVTGTVWLTGARFVGDGLSWRSGHFDDCTLEAAGLDLTSGNLTLDRSIFDHAAADLSGTQVGGVLSIQDAEIRGSQLDLSKTTMTGGAIRFDGYTITIDRPDHRTSIDLSHATLGAGALSFARTRFTRDRPDSRGRGARRLRGPFAGDLDSDERP